MEVKEVITRDFDNIKCVMLIDETNEKWVNLDSIGTICGYKNPKKSISQLYNRYKIDFLPNVLYHQVGDKGRPSLFFNREGIIRIKMLSRKFRNSTAMDELIEFLTQVDNGTLKVAHKDDIAKLQQPILGQDLSLVMKRLDDIEALIRKQNGLLLPSQELMDVPRKKLIKWLLDNMAKDFGIPGFEVWWDFSTSLRIDNYGKQPKSLFPKMLRFFYKANPKLVVRAYTWYMSTANPQEDIQKIFLWLFDPKQANLDGYSAEDMSRYT